MGVEVWRAGAGGELMSGWPWGGGGVQGRNCCLKG